MSTLNCAKNIVPTKLCISELSVLYYEPSIVNFNHAHSFVYTILSWGEIRGKSEGKPQTVTSPWFHNIMFLFASVKRFSVSRMRDLCLTYLVAKVVVLWSEHSSQFAYVIAQWVRLNHFLIYLCPKVLVIILIFFFL